MSDKKNTIEKAKESNDNEDPFEIVYNDAYTAGYEQGFKEGHDAGFTVGKEEGSAEK